MPLTDMFWGDRYGQVVDPFGHEWSIATHKEDVPPEEMKKRAGRRCSPRWRASSNTLVSRDAKRSAS